MHIDPIQIRIDSNELNHHGVLGMKWGVRRYQNKDGSLTAAGRAHYGNPANTKKIYKDLKKRIKKERVKQYGWGNQWAWSNSIGPNSKAALDKRRKALSEAESSEDAKNWKKAIRKLDQKYNRGEIDANEYDEHYEELREDFLKKTEAGKKYMANSGDYTFGIGFAKEYIEGAGKDISIAYLKDLGYAQEAAEYIEKMLAKQNRVLGG